MQHTAHTVGKVPMIVFDERFKGRKMKDGGKLADAIPTMLDIMGLEKPAGCRRYEKRLCLK
jgi:2,3-bisphosphoglycerate-independent phosphoglycerate mutase